ncbi:MAG: hypothetical protein QQN41_08560 [Nitrosopumilus sp.]
MKTLTINWFNTLDEGQAFFVDLKEAIFSEHINYDKALNGTNVDFQPQANDRMFAVDGSLIISEYVKNYEDLYEVDAIVSDDLALSMSNLKTPLFSVCDTPYLDVAKNLNENGFWKKDLLFQKGYFYAHLQKTQYDKSECVVCTSNDLKKYVKRTGFRKKIKVIEYAPSLDYWANAYGEYSKTKLKEEFGIPLEMPVGCSITKFHPDSNYTLLRDLVLRFPKVFWLIMLEGNLVHKPKSKNVKIIEWPDAEMRRKVFNASNFYVNVNKFDYKNVYALQALSCDLPIVTPKRGYFNKKWFDGFTGERKNVEITDFGIVIRNPQLRTYMKAVDDLIASSFDGERFEFRPRDHFDAVDNTSDTFAFNWRVLIEERNNNL